MQGLAKSIAWDGEGATCLIEVCIPWKQTFLSSLWLKEAKLITQNHQVTVKGTETEAEAARIARSVASSSLVKVWEWEIDFTWTNDQKVNILVSNFIVNIFRCLLVWQAAVYGRDPNWGRIAAAAGYAGVSFQMDKLRISLGEFSLMESGQPLPFDRFILQLNSSLSCKSKLRSSTYRNVYTQGWSQQLPQESRRGSWNCYSGFIRRWELLFTNTIVDQPSCILDLSVILFREQVKVQRPERPGGVILAMTMSRSMLSTHHETETEREREFHVLLLCYDLRFINWFCFQIRQTSIQ